MAVRRGMTQAKANKPQNCKRCGAKYVKGFCQFAGCKMSQASGRVRNRDREETRPRRKRRQKRQPARVGKEQEWAREVECDEYPDMDLGARLPWPSREDPDADEDEDAEVEPADDVDEDEESEVEPADDEIKEADRYVWLSMEKAFDLDMFDPVDMKASDLRAGDRGVFKVGFMQFVAVCRVLKDDIQRNRPVFGKTGKTKALDDTRPSARRTCP